LGYRRLLILLAFTAIPGLGWGWVDPSAGPIDPVLPFVYSPAQVMFEQAPPGLVAACRSPARQKFWILAKTTRPEGIYFLISGPIWADEGAHKGRPHKNVLVDDDQGQILLLQNAGICLIRIHQDADAEKYLLRALAADATSPVAKFQLAQLYLHERRFERCDFYFDLLVRSVEANADVLWLGARIAHAKNDDVTERSFDEQLQARFPDSAQADAMHHGRYDE